jgi:hypothetical protein
MRILNFGKTAQIAAALFCVLPVSSALRAQEANPFSQLAGKWHGSGQVRLTDGHAERLSCQGSYSQKSGGNELWLAIRCQSENNKIDMKSNVSYEGGSLSGHWSERNFGLEGDLSGRAAPNRFTVQILGQLQGSMTVSVTGASHQVHISNHGPGFSTVSISFSRG